ncbi:MAG: type II secretion system protein GspD [Candidatus Hydrogenedentes bacterium]|nr:type II secretion system protein GspD [Candidatus Hydrogenedentota bacterium]
MIRMLIGAASAAGLIACWPTSAFGQEFVTQEPAPRQERHTGYGSNVADDVVVQYDEETGALIVIADEDTNLQIKDVIQALDKPVPQVLIKVLFLEVTHNDGVDIGTEFFATDVDDHLLVRASGTDADGNTTYTSSNVATRTDTAETLFGIASETTGGFYRLVKDDLEITLRALSEVAKLEVLSRPSILARNNQEATITVGQEVPFIRNTRILEDGQQLNTVEYEDIGIILSVTPTIRKDGLVAMEINPEISTLTGETVPISNTVTAPVFAKRSAETGVVVPDGETVVIGGLMEDQDTESTRKVPLLGDIPIIGNAFKRKITDKAKTELLIFLTPHIIPDPSGLAAMTSNERAELELAPRVLSPEQLERLAPGNETEQQDETAAAPSAAITDGPPLSEASSPSKESKRDSERAARKRGKP